MSLAAYSHYLSLLCPPAIHMNTGYWWCPCCWLHQHCPWIRCLWTLVWPSQILELLQDLQLAPPNTSKICSKCAAIHSLYGNRLYCLSPLRMASNGTLPSKGTLVMTWLCYKTERARLWTHLTMHAVPDMDPHFWVSLLTHQWRRHVHHLSPDRWVLHTCLYLLKDIPLHLCSTVHLRCSLSVHLSYWRYL